MKQLYVNLDYIYFILSNDEMQSTENYVRL